MAVGCRNGAEAATFLGSNCGGCKGYIQPCLDFCRPMWPAAAMQTDTYTTPADRAALDRDYSPSGLVDSLDAYLDMYADRSAKARDRLSAQARLDLGYGPHARHRLDLFCTTGKNAPLVVFLHGGFWSALDESYFSFPAPVFLAAGFSYASVGYRLAPAATLTEIVKDARMATAWLAANAASFGFNARRMFLVGHSAGAHLAAMIMAGCTPASGEFKPAGATLISGVYDLEPVRHSYVNDTVGMSRAEARANSPLGMEPPADCPAAIFVGDIETDAFKWQSRNLHNIWSPLLSSCRHEVISGRNHFDILFDLSDPASSLFSRTTGLVGEGRQP